MLSNRKRIQVRTNFRISSSYSPNKHSISQSTQDSSFNSHPDRLPSLQHHRPLFRGRRTDKRLTNLQEPSKQLDPSKISVKRNGLIKAYAANTNTGIIRNYNQDRVSIVLNISKPHSKISQTWPKCSFFGIYDGHGGSGCAQFLRDQLHNFVIQDASFPTKPKEALKNGFLAAQKAFLEKSINETKDKSGSCAIVALVVGENCYVANVGDSRAILSAEKGGKIFCLSKDHKPGEEKEKQRIIQAGGRIYQANSAITDQPVGPVRVFPGRLSVSRAFGDIEAKRVESGGNPDVVITVPDIKGFKITEEHDFIFIGSDGVYDRMSNREIISCVWNHAQQSGFKIHEQCGQALEGVIRTALKNRTLDNVTGVLMVFQSFSRSK